MVEKYILTEWRSILLGVVCLGLPCMAQAQSLPGPADVGRVESPARQQQLQSPRGEAKPATIPALPIVAPPANADQLTFTFNNLELKGVKAISRYELFLLYRDHLGKTVSLKEIWDIAAKITAAYRERGYFLSRAYVPAQEIENGALTIQVIEGYVGEVAFDGDADKYATITALESVLLSERPTKAKSLESILLRLQDIPGYEFDFLLEAKSEGELGETRLVVRQNREKAVRTIELNNFGSRFLGPYQGIATWQQSFVPTHRTTFALLNTSDVDELRYGAVSHQWDFHLNWSADASLGYIKAQPGSKLESSDIDSRSLDISLGIAYQPIRQRRENLRLWARAEMRNTNSDVLDNAPLTRERLRALRVGLAYDTDDRWQGYNYVNAQLSKGIGGLGASDPNSAYLSRADANPSSTKANLSVSRFQHLATDWNLLGRVAGQWASSPLFSSEEFGLGGQEFGRAYDPSEFTGDHGVAGSVELRYDGFVPRMDIQVTPYAYYDLGKVWNIGTTQPDASAASAGVGLYFQHDKGVSGSLGVASPLTAKPGTPLYGDNSGPRINMQMKYVF